MFIALDATYLVDPHPSGIAVYSRELLDGLARTQADDRFLHLYRLKQYKKAAAPRFPNVRNRLLLPPLPISYGKRPDVFHALNQRVDHRSARHVISTFHDLFVLTGEYSSSEFRDRFAKQARQAAKRSDLIIAVSEFTKSQVVSNLNVDPARVRVIPHGVHVPMDLPSPEQREKIILCVGALQLRKNITRLVEAFELMPGRVRKGWKLVLAGSTAGFGAAAIVARIERSSARAQIQLPGYVTVSELKDLYRRAMIFAFPSLDEGFGIPVLEAMANEVPVLTSDGSALKQVANGAAILTDPQNSERMSAHLVEMIEDEALRRRLRLLGKERAKLFPWSRAVEATYAAYLEITS